MAGIYIHIPFCRRACSYCDFHFSTSLDQRKAMVQAILRESERRAVYLENALVSSIYFGGGTPSLLENSEVSMLIDTLSKLHVIEPFAEVTLEANPDDISPAKLRKWKEAGINRLSIGLQGFDNDELRWMNRLHTAEQSVTSVKMSRDAGFENISIDLIYGSRFQSLDSWSRTLEKALELQTPHISSYNLTIEKGTALGAWVSKGKEPAVDETLSGSMFHLMSDMLTGAGYNHYEISNFAKPGREAKHNSSYWRREPYLGLGPSAHSFNGSSRQWNVPNNKKYMDAVQAGKQHFEVEELSLHARYNEYVMTGLRTVQGCRLVEISDLFGNRYADHFRRSAESKKHYLVEEDGTFTLTREGRLHADGIASALFFV